MLHHYQFSLDRFLPSYSEPVEIYIANVRILEQLKQVFDAVLGRHGRDIMINVAGISNHKPLAKLSSNDWKAVIDVNFTRAFNVCKAITPLMKMCGSGRIMNNAILGGRTGRPGVCINYAASKAGLIGLTQTLARELSPWRIMVCGCPRSVEGANVFRACLRIDR